MDAPRSQAPRWIAAGLLALLVAVFAPAAAAGAESSSFDVGDQAVVIIQIAGRGNELTVRTWDRPQVQVDSAEVSPAIERRMVTFGTEKVPLAAAIPPMQYMLRENGQVVGQGMLPPEDFPYAAFRPGPHDWVRINAEAGSHLTVTIPASTGILQTRVGGGITNVDGYHGANLFVVQNGGFVHLGNVSTTAFLQMNFGGFYASDDVFDRIRVRGNGAHFVFERCRSKQIEATTVTGSMIYDGGTFDPGLARFETQSGNIALGVTGPAQLAARSQDGHVYTSFDRRTPVEQNSDGSAVAQFGGSGGPLVNAISGRGNVYLYDGSLASRRAVGPEWRPVNQLFTNHRRPVMKPQAPPGSGERATPSHQLGWYVSRAHAPRLARSPKQ